MPRYVAFLRGINLGKRRVAMSRLKSVTEELGYSEVETFIASGNVLFSAPKSETSVFESALARHLESRLGFEVDTFVRRFDDVARIAQTKAFPQDGDEGITIHVAFLHEALPKKTATALAAIRTDYDEFRVSGTEFYWLCHGGISDSKVWSLPEAKALQLPSSTMRNIKSLRKLVQKHGTTAP
ncbi:MAG: DUF1697 domain-containing protein [Verrucomicrobiales bacterium]|nr:DUF1697 domain-containing protein [Verrucomicrobiales bacterium]